MKKWKSKKKEIKKFFYQLNIKKEKHGVAESILIRYLNQFLMSKKSPSQSELDKKNVDASNPFGKGKEQMKKKDKKKKQKANRR